MTTITIGTGSTVPSDATTLTKLILWTTEQIRTLQPAKQYSVDPPGAPSRLIDIHVLPTQGYGTRATVLCFLELPSNWQSMATKIWEKVGSIPIDVNSPSGATDTFNPGTGGSIPATVTTYAKLMAWCAEAANRCNPGIYVIEDPRIAPVFVASNSAGETLDHGWLQACRFSIPINPAYGSQAAKLYTQAYNLSNVGLPSDLLT